MKCEIGDTVHVRGVVVHKDDSALSLRISIGSKGLWLPPEIIVHVEPRPFKVGDRVKWLLQIGEILCIDGSVAWIKADRAHYSALIAELVHA